MLIILVYYLWYLRTKKASRVTQIKITTLGKVGAIIIMLCHPNARPASARLQDDRVHKG